MILARNLAAEPAAAKDCDLARELTAAVTEAQVVLPRAGGSFGDMPILFQVATQLGTYGDQLNGAKSQGAPIPKSANPEERQSRTPRIPYTANDGNGVHGVRASLLGIRAVWDWHPFGLALFGIGAVNRFAQFCRGIAGRGCRALIRRPCSSSSD